MWYVSELVIFKTLIGGIFLLAVSSCGQPSGNAPGGQDPAPIPVTPPSTAVMKFGETVTTSSGWTVTVDSSDPVESSTLANGWTVEVQE